jgi:hypothetical protein
MRFALAILGLSLAGTLNAAALDVRPASELEITDALVGCWGQEWSEETMRYEERMESSLRIPTAASACFQNDGFVHLSWVEGNDGMDGGGEFEISDGKLRLRDSGNGVWIFGAAELECDVIMNPGRAMKLTNCVGLGTDAGKAIPDTSYGFRDD